MNRCMMKLNKYMLGLLCMLALLFTVQLPIYAESKTVSISFPVYQTIENSGDKDTFTYELISKDVNNPMPESTKDEKYSFSIQDNTSILTDRITYTHAGVYEYELSVVKDSSIEGLTYDEKTVTIQIYVQNVEGGLSADVIALDENGNKLGKIEFTHVFEKKTTEKTDSTNTGVQLQEGWYLALGLIALGLIIFLMIHKKKEE